MFTYAQLAELSEQINIADNSIAYIQDTADSLFPDATFPGDANNLESIIIAAEAMISTARRIRFEAIQLRSSL